MSDSDATPQPATPPPADAHSPDSSSPPSQAAAAPPAEDRSELLQRARAFLTSPQVQHEDFAAKRRFLTDKGLNDAEIEGLLREVPRPAPFIPPRTYPQPPSSNLPNLLVGIFRIATWVAGGSAALVLLYFRFIYPRIAQTFHARHAIRTHHTTLLSRLTSSLESLKATQAETFAVLPRPAPYKVEPQYRKCGSLDDIASVAGESREIPHMPLLQHAITEVTSQKQKSTAEAIFKLLEAKFPWMQAEEDAKFETQLWETLTTSPLFERKTEGDLTLFSFNPPEPAPPAPLLSSLLTLKGALPVGRAENSSLRKTAGALSDVTGFIAAQTYTLPPNYRFSATGYSALSPEEEEVRREIRALKGLVLNRRSFLPPRTLSGTAAVESASPAPLPSPSAA